MFKLAELKITKFPFFMYLEDIAPIFEISKNCHFMFFRPRSHIQDFKQLLDGSSGFLGPVFPTTWYLWSSYIWRFHIVWKSFGISWNSWSNLVSPKLNIIGLGSHGHVENPKIMNMMGFQIFPRWNLRATSTKWSRIMLRSFRATLFLKCIATMAPRPPQSPNPKFARFFYM